MKSGLGTAIFALLIRSLSSKNMTFANFGNRYIETRQYTNFNPFNFYNRHPEKMCGKCYINKITKERRDQLASNFSRGWKAPRIFTHFRGSMRAFPSVSYVCLALLFRSSFFARHMPLFCVALKRLTSCKCGEFLKRSARVLVRGFSALLRLVDGNLFA